MATTKRTTARRGDDEKPLPTKLARVALDRTTQMIKRLRRDSARNFWTIGRRLAQVAELQLHKARGFASLEEYAEKVLDLPRATAFQYMRVATVFSEEVAATFGVEKLDRGLAYIARTPAGEEPSDLPELRLEIPGEDGEPARTKRFAETTTAELRRAVKKLGGKESPRRRDGNLPVGAAETIARADRALDQSVGRAAAGGADVIARLAGKDRVLLDVRGVPLDRAARAFRALAAAIK